MSFDFTPVRNLSNVQSSAKSCPGGGGNTGYFKRGKKDENEEVFPKEYPGDDFQKQETEDTFETNETLLEAIKNIFKELLEVVKSFFGK